MKHKPKAIVLDLDGTLLRSDKSISERTKSVLKECRKQGIVVAVATARFWFKAEQFLNVIEPDYALLADGTQIYQSGEMIHGFLLDEWKSDGIINELRKTGEATEFVVSIGKMLLCSSKGIDEKWRQTWDFKELPREHVYKIAAIMASREEAEMLAEKYDCRMHAYRGESLYSFSSKTAGKYQAVLALGELLGITPEDMVAFGDDENDYEILKHCGKGIAVANAIPIIKDIADEVTESNDDDGVAAYLEKYCLL